MQVNFEFVFINPIKQLKNFFKGLAHLVFVDSRKDKTREPFFNVITMALFVIAVMFAMPMFFILMVLVETYKITALQKAFDVMLIVSAVALYSFIFAAMINELFAKKKKKK